ncbi:MAG: N-acetyltransferase [Bacteroidia bacterium]
MEINIRQEIPADYRSVILVIGSAFKNAEWSNQKEHLMVQRLRNSAAFIPELSLVAETENRVIGHILLFHIKIKRNQNEYPALGLAPVSVLPQYQRKGIGGRLIRKAHSIASKMGFNAVILVGHAGYYPRFGYRKARDFGIYLPFEVPDEYCFVIELKEKGLEGVSGMVEYPDEFYQ